MKKQILFVDDMKQVYDKIRNCLGEVFDYASTEEEGLRKINERDYNLVVTDYDLEDASHNGGLRIIKAAEEKGLVSMLISTENHKKEALDAGANGFMFKKDFLEIFGQDGRE